MWSVCASLTLLAPTYAFAKQGHYSELLTSLGRVNIAGTVMEQALMSGLRQRRVCWGFDGRVGATVPG